MSMKSELKPNTKNYRFSFSVFSKGEEIKRSVIYEEQGQRHRFGFTETFIDGSVSGVNQKSVGREPGASSAAYRWR